MRRAAVIAATGLLLTGCSSFSIPGLDSMRSTPTAVTLQLESSPPGAEAKTSIGPACRTPCSIAVAADAPFTVTYTLPRHQPQTVAVQLIEKPGKPDAQNPDVFGPSVVDLDPNPVFAQLEPAGAAKRGGRPKAVVQKAKRAPKAAPAAAAPAQDASPFPPPAGTGSPFPTPQR